MQIFFAYSGLLNGIAALLFGLFVIIKNHKKKTNKLFFLLTLATSLWSFSYWRWLSIYDDPSSALFWARMLSLGSSFIPTLYLHWSLVLIKKEEKKKYIIRAAYLLTLFIILFSFSPYFVSGVEANHGFAYWPVPGLIYHFYLLVCYIGFVGYSLLQLFSTHKNSTGLLKSQLKYVIVGSLLGLGGGFFNFFLWYKIPILPYGNVLIVLYPLFFTYAMIRYRLMDIRLIIKKGLVYTLLLFIIVIIVSFLVFLLGGFFQDFFQVSYIITASICALVIALILQPIRKFLYKYVNSIYYKRRTTQEIKRGVSMALKKNINLEKNMEKLSEMVKNDLKIKDLFFQVLNVKEKVYETVFSNVEVETKILSTEYLATILKRENKIFIKEEIPYIKKDLENEEDIECLNKIENKLKEVNMEVVVPIIGCEELVAIFFLGNKKNKEAYSVEDIEYLGELSQQAGFYIANVLLYKQGMERVLG